MRAYGNNTEILIDRDREAKSHALLADQGLAPPLLARFNNGLLYKYIQGQVCTPKDLTREPVWRGVARKLAEWHAKLPIGAVQQNGPMVDGVNGDHPGEGIDSRHPKPNIWTVMLKWVNALPTKTSAERDRKEQLRQELENSFTELDSITSLGEQGFVFGHCDLLSANLIMVPQSPSSSSSATTSSGTPAVESVAFIDYEYATPCPAAFDIANHFAEWGGYDCDYNMLPTRSIRRAFLSEYLSSYYSHLPPPPHNRRPREEDPAQLDRLMSDIDSFRGMPGLYWGIWALIQATISQIDFDYASYAEVRLGEYWAWRAEVDGSRARDQGKEIPLRERRWAEE